MNAQSTRSVPCTKSGLGLIAHLAGMASIALVVTARVAAQSDAAKVLDTSGASLTKVLMSDVTPIQVIRPQFTQRGVNIDGSLRAPSVQGWALAANPFPEPATGMAWLGDIRLDTGTYSPTEIDLAFPCVGPAWTIGRSHNPVQLNATDTAFNLTYSGGAQGRFWFQMSQPELVFKAGSTSDKDMLYLVYGADRYIEFKRTGTTASGATTFKSLNGAAGVLNFASGTGGAPGTYTWTDQHGTETVFFAGDYDDGTTYPVAGQLWKITDANAKTAYVGDSSSNAVTAITSGYAPSTGVILKAFDSAGRRFTYTYGADIGGIDRLSQVIAEVNSGGWTTVGTVAYTYYDTDVSGKGKVGDLKLVKVSTPLSDGSTTLDRYHYYRYYTETYNSSTSPGHVGQIKMVVAPDGVRRYDWLDSSLTDTLTDLDAASDGTLTPYSSVVLEYHDANIDGSDSNKYIRKATFNGECGCSGGGGNGTYEFSYSQVSTYGTWIAGTAYDTGWAKRTVVKRPDLTYETQYFDEVSQPLSRVTTGQDPTGTITTWWATSVTRDSGGLVTEIGTPESVSAYTHSTGTLTEAGSTGLISVIERQPTGDMAGLPIGRRFRQAGGSTLTYESSADLIAGTDLTAFTKTISGAVAVIRPLADDQRVYPMATSSRTDSTANLTSVALTAHSGSLMIASAISTLPIVTAGNNGSDASNVRSSYATIDGRTAFTKNEEGIIGFRAYDTVTGQLKTSIQDADTSNADVTSVMSAPTGFTSSGTALHYKTTYTYDAQGRMLTSTSPDGRVSRMYYTKLGDGRMVTLSIPRDVSGTYSGPVGYSITNHAGKSEAQGVIGLSSGTSTAALNTWISTSATNPVSALAVGTLVRLSTTDYDSSGHRPQNTRTYFVIPAGGGWPGNSTSNFDETAYGYDDMGRTRRVKSSAGDISRTVFDALGRVTERWLGTNDASFAGGESSGTDNMTMVETLEYDSGATAKNSRLTSRTQDPDGNWGTTSDQRITSMIYDFRGRVIVTSNPLAPHSATSYDNLGRATAAAQFSSTVSSATTPITTTGRIAYRESVFDELGRVWKSTRHKITQSSGSSADTIDTLTWFDPVGRVIKVRGENQHSKARFDRLGRAVQQFTLSSDNDTTYANVYASGKTDVVGDFVVEQSSTGYDNTSKTGLALVRAQVSRHWNDSSTTGELDTNADGVDTTITAANVKGRVQISAMWYDNLNRLIDTVNLGTNAIVGDGTTATGTYTRGTTVTSGQPSRSDTALRTSYVYDSAGVVQDVTDPRNLTSRTEYDQAGRRTATIANHTGATPPLTTANRDNDLYTRYTYDKGRQTEMWVDIDGDNAKDSDDQFTTYVFGVTKSSSLLPSQIASNSALRMTIYPDSAATSANVESGSSTDAVVMSYTALSQPRSRRDQNGNVIDYTFDALGRETSRAVTTLGSGVDGSVRRIETA
ncbi:MAG: hypothetical protein K2W85_03315 [Phycisphaerales bacterium]|nr:hypothetical protein [Phycisphaerales bacterium]